MCHKTQVLETLKKTEMSEETSIKEMEEDLVKTSVEVNVVESKKKRKRGKKNKTQVLETPKKTDMPEETSIKEMEEDLVKAPAEVNVVESKKKRKGGKKNKTQVLETPKKTDMPEETSIKGMEEDLVKTPAEVNVVESKKKRKRGKKKKKRKKKKTGDALAVQITNQVNTSTDNPEGGNILVDVDMAMEMSEVPLRINMDSTAMDLAVQWDEATNQQLLLAVPFQVPGKVRTVSSRRKLLILDLNGLLADIVLPPPRDRKSDINISGRAVFRRPCYYAFLKFCFERFDVGVWSSRSKKIVDRVVDYLFGGLKHRLLFCWDMSHCTGTRFKTLENRHKPLVFKELRKLWEKHYDNLPWEMGVYNESNTVLLDDSPYKALLNPMNTSIFPFTFSYKDNGDKSLGVGGDLRVYLEGLAKEENVQTYIQQHPFGQCAINETSSLWDFYSRVLQSVLNLTNDNNFLHVDSQSMSLPILQSC